MGKYTKGKSIMKCDIRTGSSSMWRGIMRSFFYMVKGSFGIWIGNEPLCTVIDDIDPMESMWNVEDILDEEGRWVLGRLKTNRTEEVRNKIIAI